MTGKDEKNTVSTGGEAVRSDQSPIEFPARFPIKVMGRNQAAFQKAVGRIVVARIAREDVLDIKEKLSENERFLSITITARFTNKAMIDGLYEALTTEPEVMMAL